MLSQMDLEFPITNYAELQMALNQCTHAKNPLSIRYGYAPGVIVFGKHTRLPGSVLSDTSPPSHEQVMQEETDMSSEHFRQTLAIREAARRAFHASDNSDVLRRALLRRACPSRGLFPKGDWVMTWKSGPINQHRWSGPHRVILQDENHTVWCTSNGKLLCSATENIRKALPEEGSPEGPELPADITPMAQQIARMSQNTNGDQMDSKEALEIPTDTTSNNNPPNPDNEPAPNNPSTNSNDSQDEYIPQPDQEPENVTPETSHAVPLERQNKSSTPPIQMRIKTYCF